MPLDQKAIDSDLLEGLEVLCYLAGEAMPEELLPAMIEAVS